jgi:hypothetical protein
MGERAKTYNSHFEYVLANNGPGYLYTPDQIQPEDSDTCGATAVISFESDIDAVLSATS